MEKLIPEKLLKSYGAEKQRYNEAFVIYKQGARATHYYQIAAGKVKLCNISSTGKEYIQRMFSSGQAFGEPPLFGEFGYPANAITTTDSSIWVLPKKNLYQLLRENPEIHFKMTSVIAFRFYHKAMTAWEMSELGSKERIYRQLQYLKEESDPQLGEFAYEIELTRKQIADIMGIREETVIRTVKQLEKEGRLKIVKRKIFI